MMKINRREFLKILVAGGAAVVTPAALGLLEGATPPRLVRVQFTCGVLPAGDYFFSFHTKSHRGGGWQQHMETLTLPEKMPLVACAELERGDLIWNVMVEDAKPVIAYRDGVRLERSRTNFYPESELMGHLVDDGG